MTKLNWGLLVCGVVGAIVAIALPIAETGPIKIKLFDPMLGNHGYIVLAALLGGAAMGAMNLFKAPARWSGGVAIVAFLVAGMKLSGGDEGPVIAGAGATGAMMLAFVGAVLAIVLTIKPGKPA